MNECERVDRISLHRGVRGEGYIQTQRVQLDAAVLRSFSSVVTGNIVRKALLSALHLSTTLTHLIVRAEKMSTAAPSQRSKVKRLPDRCTYEIQQIYDILDEGLVAHVGIVQDGLPLVIPMGYARRGDQLLLHGSVSSRLMKVSSPADAWIFSTAVQTAQCVTLHKNAYGSHYSSNHEIAIPCHIAFDLPSHLLHTVHAEANMSRRCLHNPRWLIWLDWSAGHESWRRHLCHCHAAGWLGACSLCLPSLHELPLSGAVWPHTGEAEFRTII